MVSSAVTSQKASLLSLQIEQAASPHQTFTWLRRICWIVHGYSVVSGLGHLSEGHINLSPSQIPRHVPCRQMALWHCCWRLRSLQCRHRA